MSKNKVLLIGWDAADWKLIWPLIKKGQMPALKGLIEKGVYGNMSTMNPPYSPMLWSSVATGKTPDKHGVLGFIEVKDDSSGVQPVTVNSRKVRALWNIFHNQDMKSNVVGWWPSFPAEEINGVVVTDRFQKVNKNPEKLKPILKDAVHPKSMLKNLSDLRMFPWEITEAHILPFFPKATEIDQEKDKRLQTFAKLLAENTSIHSVATNLLRTTEWDFMAVYYDLIDHFCHAFMKFHPPKMHTIPQNQFDIYKDAVEGAYRYQDMMLARTLELIDDDTTVIVMSDHGYESGHKRILKMPKYPAAPALEHRQFGIFVAAGPNIKKNEKVFGLGLIDIAPTILHMHGLPIGKDMDGKVALDIFEDPEEPNYIESWEKVKGDFGQHNSTKDDSISDEVILQQLVDLGYIEQPDEKMEIAVLKTKCDLKHNLARVKLGIKDYDASKIILKELVETEYPIYDENDIKKDEKGNLLNPNIKVGESVVDVIPYFMDLLMISLKEEDFVNAKLYLKEIKAKDKNGLVNTIFAESKVLVNEGEYEQGLKLLEGLKDKRSGAEVWFQIGKIKRKLSRYKEAKEAFEEALKYEIDSAKMHKALAEVLLRLNEHEEAAEHALVAIELIKYYPEAHYVLGEALEKLGHIEDAKQAYATAAKLRPKTHHRAKMALENIDEKLTKAYNFDDKFESKYRENQIVIVSGLPRSGTSMMMQMLDKGGLGVLTDKKRQADDSNPKGYYEYDPVLRIKRDNTWLDKAVDNSVKVVAPLLKFLDSKYRYKIIFMNRDLSEIVKSQQKMIGKNPDILPLKLIQAYKEQLDHVEVWKNKEPNVEMIYVNYKDALNNTEEILEKVTSFIGVEMDKEKMAKCVDKSLHRNKS